MAGGRSWSLRSCGHLWQPDNNGVYSVLPPDPK
jgi:hypothetical protein